MHFELDKARSFNQHALTRLDELQTEANQYVEQLKTTFSSLLDQQLLIYTTHLDELRKQIQNDQLQIEDVKKMVEEMLSKKKENFLKRCLMMITENQQILQTIASEKNAIQIRRNRLEPNLQLFKASHQAKNILLTAQGTPEHTTSPSNQVKDLRNLVAVLKDQVRQKDRIIQTLEIEKSTMSPSSHKRSPKKQIVSTTKSPLRDQTESYHHQIEHPQKEQEPSHQHQAATLIEPPHYEEESISSNLHGMQVLSTSKVLKGQNNQRSLEKFFNAASVRVQKMELIFRASQHNFIATTYHQKCDKVKDTLLLAVSEKGNVFGGYTPVPTSSTVEEVYFTDITGTSFLFSLTHNQMFKLKADQKKRAICPIMSWGPRFGKGSDLAICDRCNMQDYSSSRLGTTYQLPAGMREQSAKTLLMGASQSKIREYEVYAVTVQLG